MKESTKTAAFVGSAVAMLLAAVFTGYANQPQPADDYETIGLTFYPDFEQTDQAKSLVVTSIDPDTVKQQTFEIKQIDGLWQIPSHEGYPAEAAQRLAQTSASLVGLTRDSLVGRRASDHQKFGVVDPRDDDVIDIDSVGQSIALRDANEDVLVDLIIGDPAPGDAKDALVPADQQASYYYVRRADETNVYRIPLDIELSTKFSDWIEPDLLQLNATDVVALDLDNYQIEERSSGMFGQVKQLLKTQGDQIALTRKSSTDDWELKNSDGEKPSQLIQDAVTKIVAVLDDMAIADVKKKPTLDGKILLDADLNYSLTPAQAALMSIRTQEELDALTPAQQAEFQSIQVGVMELQRDLESRGFSFGSTGQALELVSAGGEMQAGTADGLRYTLHVGKAPTDTKDQIKIPGTDQDDDESPAADGSDTDQADGQSADEKTESERQGDDPETGDGDSGDDSSRYVLIRVAFDQTLLDDPGDKPAPPQPPTKPEGYAPADPNDGAATESSDGETDGENEDGDQDQAEGEDDSAPKPSDMQRNPAFVQYDNDLAAFEDAKVDYEVALNQWQSATEKLNQQIKEGKQKADILNGRFEKWYYIVSAENLKTLQSDREDLVQPVIVTTDEDEAMAEAMAEARKKAAAAMQDRPDVSFPEIDTPPASETDDPSSPADGQPVPEVEKPAVDPSASSSDDAAVEKPETESPAVESTQSGDASQPADADESSDGGQPVESEPAAAVEDAADTEPTPPENPPADLAPEDSANPIGGDEAVDEGSPDLEPASDPADADAGADGDESNE